jgi:hypothetical protein
MSAFLPECPSCVAWAEQVDALTRERDQLRAAAEMLWVVIANVSGSDWSTQTEEWQEAAARWRDAYFAALKPTP